MFKETQYISLGIRYIVLFYIYKVKYYLGLVYLLF